MHNLNFLTTCGATYCMLFESQVCDFNEHLTTLCELAVKKIVLQFDTALLYMLSSLFVKYFKLIYF